VRGAFTGAVRDKEGLLESARGGTVFLDEIGELSPAIQAKLLRVIEERMVTRVGSVTPHPIDVRFIAATNRDLKAEAEAGRFRSDLYFRLNGISLLIPPLRDRPSEIEPLARRFTTSVVPDAPRVELGPDAAACLARYAWPGNVRELRNAMERASVLAGSGPITPEHLPPEIAESAGFATSHTGMSATSASDASDSGDASLQSQMEALEKRRIVEALEQCDGNQTKAAELLGMPRRTFVKRLDAYGIGRPRKK
jgi:DNA-binding NtrC family response regulator